MDRGPQKIVLVAAWYPSPAAPLDGIFVQDQAQCLARVYDVAVLAPRIVGWHDWSRLRLGPRWAEEETDRVRVWRMRRLVWPRWDRFLPWPRLRADGIVVYCRRYAKALRQTFRAYVKRHGAPDVLHAHVALPSGWAAVQLGREYSVPVVFTGHSGSFAAHLSAPGQYRLVQEALHGAARILAVSPSLARTINDSFPEVKVDVVGNLVRTDLFAPGPSDREPGGPLRFLSVARLSPEKGFEYLLRAVRLLLDRGIEGFELSIGGDGDDRPRLEGMARELGLGGHCRFLGELGRAETPERMRACDVFIMPSLGETFCVALGEAMACGKPVLATRCGGPEFVVGPESGVFVPPADAEALAGAMADFVTARRGFDPQVIRQTVVDRFGEATFLRTISKIYAEAAGF